LALSVAVFAAVLAACSDTDDRQYLVNARDYLHEQNLRAAIIELKNALREDPHNAETCYLLGRIYLDIGDAARAEKELGRASEAGWDPNQVTPALAEALLLQGNYAELLEGIAVRADYPRSVRAELIALRALALFGQDRSLAAEQTLERAIQLDSTPEQVWLARIQLALQKENLSRAAQVVEEALKAHPQDPRLRLWQGRLALAHVDLAGAEDAFARVIATTPSKPITRTGWDARIGLTRVQITQHGFEQAEATVQTLLTQSPANPEVNYLSGTVAFERGDYELALKRLVRVLKVVDHIPSMLLLGAVCYAQQNYEQASAAAPGNAAYRAQLAKAYLILMDSQTEKAVQELEALLTQGDRRGQARVLLVMAYLRAGRSQKAIAVAQDLLANYPDAPGILTVVGGVY
jgi:putative PEP-CTERM system TPR-repeat lipoprotein